MYRCIPCTVADEVFGFTAKLRLTWGVTNTNTIMLTSVQFSSIQSNSISFFYCMLAWSEAWMQYVCVCVRATACYICMWIYMRERSKRIIISLGPKCHKQDNWLQPSSNQGARRNLQFFFDVHIIELRKNQFKYIQTISSLIFFFARFFINHSSDRLDSNDGIEKRNAEVVDIQWNDDWTIPFDTLNFFP